MPLAWQGRQFLFHDTAGMRRRSRVEEKLEKLSVADALRAIRFAEVVVVMLDAEKPFEEQDLRIADLVVREGRALVLAMNKWDLVVSQLATQQWVDYLRETFPTLAYVPIAFITGQTGKNLKALLNHAQMLFKQSRARVGTGELNRLVRRALELHPPPLHKNRRPKMYYATQVAIQPPTIVVMCNMPQAFSADYRRYLLGVLRDELSFGEVPIRLFLHRRGADDRRDDVGG